jgi:drug/metabolite transporter (DMT)-like permease
MEKSLSKKFFPYIALFIVNSIWALSAIVAKEAFTEINPYILLFLRFSIASIVFAPLILVKNKYEPIKLNNLPRLILLSFLISVLGGGCWVIGLSYTTATNAAIIASLGPVIATVLERLVLKKTHKKIAYIGTILGFVGAILIILKPIIVHSQQSLEASSPFLYTFYGDFLIFLSAFGSATYVILAHKRPDKLHSYQKTALSFVVGSICFLPFFLFSHFNNPQWVYNVTEKGLIGILYFAIGCSALAYGLWQWAVEGVSALESTIFTYVEPLITIIAAIIFLKETLTIVEIIGGLLTIIGVFFVTIEQK